MTTTTQTSETATTTTVTTEKRKRGWPKGKKRGPRTPKVAKTTEIATA